MEGFETNIFSALDSSIAGIETLIFLLVLLLLVKGVLWFALMLLGYPSAAKMTGPITLCAVPVVLRYFFMDFSTSTASLIPSLSLFSLPPF